MPKSSEQAPSGVVSTLQGRASVVRAGEDMPQALNVGDRIAAGDVILAAADTHIEVGNAEGPAWLPRDVVVAAADTPLRANGGGSAGSGRDAMLTKANNAQSLDSVLDAVDRGDADTAAAAGLTGGGGASLSGGLRVDRIIEVVTPQAFAVSTALDNVPGRVETTVPQASTAAERTVVESRAKLSH